MAPRDMITYCTFFLDVGRKNDFFKSGGGVYVKDTGILLGGTKPLRQ